MIIYTDDRSFGDELFDLDDCWQPAGEDRVEPALLRLIGELFSGGTLFRANARTGEMWKYGFAVRNASRSQYDLLVALARDRVRLPDGVVCLAGSGREFHGQRGRPWSALEGNLHLSMSLAPARPIERFHSGFSILAAVALVSAIERFDALRGAAGIKWVNDVLIDGAKVAGFLAHSASIGRRVSSAVLGIGLNIAATPDIPADRFVPRVASLREFLPGDADCTQRRVLGFLLEALDGSYGELLAGGYHALLERYRERSLVVGRHVRIYSDAPEGEEVALAAGRVQRIGDNLELYLDTAADPVTSGRLALESEQA